MFTNGNIVSFGAQEFDADLTHTVGPAHISKFPYKDTEGQDSFIHLKPNDVAGLFITSDENAITYSLAHQH